MKIIIGRNLQYKIETGYKRIIPEGSIKLISCNILFLLFENLNYGVQR